jgi:hypothetical protein
MLITLKIIEAKRWNTCAGCSGSIRVCEKFLQILQDNKQVRGERYCLSCLDIAQMNHPGLTITEEQTTKIATRNQ